jgi:hypothetical protein
MALMLVGEQRLPPIPLSFGLDRLMAHLSDQLVQVALDNSSCNSISYKVVAQDLTGCLPYPGLRGIKYGKMTLVTPSLTPTSLFM